MKKKKERLSFEKKNKEGNISTEARNVATSEQVKRIERAA